MTSRPIKKTPATTSAEKFPDFPPRDDMQNSLSPGRSRPTRQPCPHGTSECYDTTIVLSEMPLVRRIPEAAGRVTASRTCSSPSAWNTPAFAVEQSTATPSSDQGKPPDFVLEVASPSTGREDYTAEDGTTTPPSASPNTGGLTPRAVCIPRARPWPATGWWMAASYQPVEDVRRSETGPPSRGHSDGAGPGPVLGGRAAPLVRPGERPLPAHLRRRPGKSAGIGRPGQALAGQIADGAVFTVASSAGNRTLRPRGYHRPWGRAGRRAPWPVLPHPKQHTRGLDRTLYTAYGLQRTRTYWPKPAGETWT